MPKTGVQKKGQTVTFPLLAARSLKNGSYAAQIDSAVSWGFYHVMSWGDRREDIFLDDVDRQDFVAMHQCQVNCG